MKHSALVLLLAASVSCFAQNSGSANSQTARGPGSGTLEDALKDKSKTFKLDPEALYRSMPLQGSQVGCPVELTSASILPKGRLLPVKNSGSGYGDLQLGFRNVSGKQIRSISVVAELKIKRSVYDLDSTTVDVKFALPGLFSSDKDSTISRTMALTVGAFGFDRVRLEQVEYADGTTWSVNRLVSCSVANQGTLLTELQ